MMSCPGPVDGMGCKSPATCVSYGEECPFFCPFVAPVDCGEGMMNCPGPMDGMGCMTADTCVAVGDQCPMF